MLQPFSQITSKKSTETFSRIIKYIYFNVSNSKVIDSGHSLSKNAIRNKIFEFEWLRIER